MPVLILVCNGVIYMYDASFTRYIVAYKTYFLMLNFNLILSIQYNFAVIKLPD